MVKLNLGCGKNVLEGWHNIDSLKRREGIIISDLKEGLKYEDNSVNFIYSEHFIEHLDEVDGYSLLQECYRVLSDNGVLRISTPDLDTLLDFYCEYKDKELDLSRYRGKRNNYRNACQMVNWWMFGQCGHINKFLNPLSYTSSYSEAGHRYYYNFSDLSNKLIDIGFQEVHKANFCESNFSQLVGIETRKYNGELIIEGIK